MRISRVLNNNVVMAQKDDKILLLMGLSIGFKKKAGDDIDDDKIEKTFVLTDESSENRLLEMMSFIPNEYFEFAMDAVSLIKSRIDKEFNDNLYIMITDHIYSSVDRYRQGIEIDNALLMETKKFYKEEFLVAKEVVNKANTLFNVHMKEDEAAFIAFHIVNSIKGNRDSSIQKMTRLIKDILDFIKEKYEIEYNEDSFVYSRFVTHLKYFSQKVFSSNIREENVDSDLIELVKMKYPKEYNAALEILNWIEENYNYNASEMDALYLTIHISRIIKG